MDEFWLLVKQTVINTIKYEHQLSHSTYCYVTWTLIRTLYYITYESESFVSVLYNITTS